MPSQVNRAREREGRSHPLQGHLHHRAPIIAYQCEASFIVIEINFESGKVLPFIFLVLNLEGFRANLRRIVIIELLS